MKKIVISVFTLIIFIHSKYALANSKDSLTTMIIHGQSYILYKVEKGEGALSISNRFNIPLSLLAKENNIDLNKLKKGQIIKIPIKNNKSLGNKQLESIQQNHANAESDKLIKSSQSSNIIPWNKNSHTNKNLQKNIIQDNIVEETLFLEKLKNGMEVYKLTQIPTSEFAKVIVANNIRLYKIQYDSNEKLFYITVATHPKDLTKALSIYVVYE